MRAIKDISDMVRGSLIPQLFILRRAPMRYRHILHAIAHSTYRTKRTS